MNLMIISRILESIPIIKSRKITTITVDNGKKALDAILSRKKNIILILMDCEMPIMDGYEACSLIH
jgi:CheY-like chemotaxis protein